MGNDTREQSKKKWDTHLSNFEALNCGSLQRIADATELMAINHINLQNELDRYKMWYNEERECTQRMARTISAQKGVITKLKNKLQNGR